MTMAEVATARFSINPITLVGAANDSNYWQAETQEVSVNTYFVRPGIELGFETPKTTITFDATVDFYWYDDQDTPPVGIQDASDDDYVGFTGDFNADYQLTNRLNIGLSDQLYITRDPARSDINSNSISRDKYTINYFEPTAYYEFADKFGLLASYRNTMTDYESELEDSEENRGVFDLYYLLNRSAAVYAGYAIWERDYDQDSSDYLSNFVSLNYEHQFNYFTIKGGGGYHKRTFDEPALDDLDLFSWKIQIRGQEADTTYKTMNNARSMIDGRSFRQGQDVDLLLDESRSLLTLDLGQEMNNDGTGDNYYTATYARFEGGYRFFGKLETLLRLSVQNSDYETDERNEDTYFVSASIGYWVLDYLLLGFEGGYETRDSNFTGNNYDNTFAMVMLNFDYNFSGK
ncbi:MAG: outer membrane beta-barrel protein [Desulfocapsa sp.]|nr:outer membrane beta-barrel protein [Desulfocapsa sp.]